MEQKDLKESKNSERKSKDGCEGKQCYHSIKATECAYYTYKQDVDKNEDCDRPSATERFGVEGMVFGELERYAKAHCKANGNGDEDCNNPCECKPEITGHEIKFGKIRKVENRCQIFVEASISIKCRCSD